MEKRSAELRHEIGNALSIAQANLEGMLDGVIEPSLDRLEGIRDALAAASEGLIELATHLEGK